MQEELLALVPQRNGHFRFESGHHGDLWLDLDALFVRPAALEPFVAALARRIEAKDVDAVCGPLVGGAFLAQMIARRLDIEFYHTERLAGPMHRLPPSSCLAIRGKRVAVVDDVTNAASAVSATKSAA